MAFYPVSRISPLLPKPSDGNPLFMALDGGSGSGKTTLAREWAIFDPQLTVIALDDFYIPVNQEAFAKRGPQEEYEFGFDRKRFSSQVLEPLLAGKPAKYQRLNWETSLLEGWSSVEPRGLVLIEGVYSHRPEWRKFWDFTLWVEAPSAVRRARMELRRQNTARQMDCWQAADDWYAATHRPRESADVVLDGITGAIAATRSR